MNMHTDPESVQLKNEDENKPKNRWLKEKTYHDRLVLEADHFFWVIFCVDTFLGHF